MTIEIQFSNQDKTLTISIGELFNFKLLDEFRQAYLDPRARQADIVIDLRQTRGMDSSALGMLLNMQQHLGRDNGQIRIVNASPDIKRILLIARFDKKFTIE